MIAPLLDEIAREKAGAVKVAKVNVDDNQSLSFKYNIRAIPALLFFKNGELSDQVIGVTSKKDLLSRLEGLCFREGKFPPVGVCPEPLRSNACCRLREPGAIQAFLFSCQCALASGRGGQPNENHNAIATGVAAEIDVKIGLKVVDRPNVAGLIDHHIRQTH
jgi:hypothetical protein